MRARAGDPPRTMAQKVLAGRAAADPSLSGQLVLVKVDQVVLAHAPLRSFAEATLAGIKRTPIETAIAYDGACVTENRGASTPGSPSSSAPVTLAAAAGEMLGHGLTVARPGIGYPSSVHLERFASPARLCVTDEARLAGVGGVGMLSLVLPPGQLGQALATGAVWLRPPRSIQVLLTGRVRPFVCARDVALELMRRGLGDAVRRVEAEHAAPVVLEFAGPSVRLLSVGERAVLAGIAPQLGAAATLFVSDERTEVFLRDQRRSKAHRVLSPDAGAPCDDVVNLDLGAVDPLLLDESGQVRAVRDLAGKPVTQVLLGGDSGATLRDLFAAAALLKSKRVPSRLDFLISVPSRQMLEVLASTGALTDLVATGARLIEPDARVMTGGIYPPPPAGISARTCDPEPREGGARRFIVASAETLAYAVASGEIGDPRLFKRPVRVTVPRALPTDDALVVRDRGFSDVIGKKPVLPAPDPPVTWKGGETVEIVDGAGFDELQARGMALRAASTGSSAGAPASSSGASSLNGKGHLAVLCGTLEEVRRLALHAAELAPAMRAVLAPFIPSGLVAIFSGVGVAAIQLDAAAAKGLKGKKSLVLPPLGQWAERNATSVQLGSGKVSLTWLALGAERMWTSAGTSRVTASGPPAKG
jgi:aconitate hydratase